MAKGRTLIVFFFPCLCHKSLLATLSCNVTLCVILECRPERRQKTPKSTRKTCKCPMTWFKPKTSEADALTTQSPCDHIIYFHTRKKKKKLRSRFNAKLFSSVNFHILIETIHITSSLSSDATMLICRNWNGTNDPIKALYWAMACPPPHTHTPSTLPDTQI